MKWENLISEVILLWLVLLAMTVLAASLSSQEMKGKNKIIFSSICVLILLFYPFGKKIEARNLVYNEGYSIVEAGGLSSKALYVEIDKKEGLTAWYTLRPIIYKVNRENKLIYIDYYYRTMPPPKTLEQIEFFDKE